MSDSEWKQFLEDLFTSFPGMMDYIASKSVNKEETLRKWRKTLEGVSFEEASAVLDDWLMGRREAPKAYERDYIAITIRSLVAGARTRRATEASLREAEEAKKRAKETREALNGIGVYAAYMACLSVNRKLEAKEIGHAQHKEEIQKILRVVG